MILFLILSFLISFSEAEKGPAEKLEDPGFFVTQDKENQNKKEKSAKPIKDRLKTPNPQTLKPIKPPKELDLPPIFIKPEGLYEQTRSVKWPSSLKPSPSILNLPQMDSGLNSLGGVQIRSQGSPVFSLRGSSQSGRALVLFNDTPLNFASGFGPPVILLPKEMIGSVSIIKGPASLFYGSQAMGGSFNFIPKIYKTPQVVISLSETDKSFLPWERGGLGHYNLQIASPLIQTKKDFLQISLFSENDDGQFPYRHNQSVKKRGKEATAHQFSHRYSPSKNQKKTTTRARADSPPKPFPSLGRHQNLYGRKENSIRTSGVRHFNGNRLLRAVLNGENQWKGKLKLNYDGIIGKQKRQSPGPVNNPIKTEEESFGGLISLTPHYFFNDWQSLRSKISYLQIHSEFKEHGAEKTGVDSKTFNKQRTWILQNEWIMDFDSLTQIQIFADHFNHQLDNSFAGSGLEQGSFEVGPLFSFHSLFNLKHQIGGRYLVQRNYFLPSMATSLSFKNYKSWVSYSKGFRSPTLSDLYSQSLFFKGNPHLKPEESEQYELGFKQKGESPFDFDLRFFYMAYKNFIESVSISPGVFSRQNQGQGYALGFDMDLSYLYGPLKTHLNYNFLETRKRSTGWAFRLSPRHQISWGGFYRFRNMELEIRNIHWYKTFDIYNNKNIELGDWQDWNLLLHGHFLRKKIKLSLGLINAFDQAKQLSLYYPEPQRRFWLQLSLKF